MALEALLGAVMRLTVAQRRFCQHQQTQVCHFCPQLLLLQQDNLKAASLANSWKVLCIRGVCLSWLGRLYRCICVLLQGIGASSCE